MSGQTAMKSGEGYAGGALPPEMDLAFYRATYADLQPLSNEQLAQHYGAFGRSEGRMASPAGSRHGFLALVPPDAKILEIGPGHSPGFTSENTKYFDVVDSEGLRKRALHYSENPARVPPLVHYVSPKGDLGIVQEQFDVVYSSHAIEHQPDLVKHLQEVTRLLAPGGSYFVICPDKRYCFDRHIPESSIGEVLEAHMVGRSIHRPADYIDALAMGSHNDPVRHWAGDSPRQGINAALATQAIEEMRAANGAYIDCHAWRLTPTGFREIVEALYQLGKSPLRPVRLYETTLNQNDFFTVLQRGEG